MIIYLSPSMLYMYIIMHFLLLVATYTRLYIHIYIDTIVNTTCPRLEGYICKGADHQEIPQYIDTMRDCNGGRGRTCTKNDPCTPCDVITLNVRIHVNKCIYIYDYVHFCVHMHTIYLYYIYAIY